MKLFCLISAFPNILSEFEPSIKLIFKAFSKFLTSSIGFLAVDAEREHLAVSKVHCVPLKS